MNSQVVRIDTRMPEDGQTIFERSKRREMAMSRLLIAYIVSGLLFMLLPGTFLGVWNLISISNRQAAESISPAWIQAHGHAQIFGWIGTFILGIGFYSIPTVRRKFALATGWACAGMWVSGVLLRWLSNVYQWHWRILVPVSAVLELAAFLLFFRAVSKHSPQDSGKDGLEGWVWVVIAGTVGFLSSLMMNAGAAFYVALRGADPSFPQGFDQRFLVMCAWGFLVPFVYGFGTKWLPIFLGLRKTDMHLLATAVAVNTVGVAVAQFGAMKAASLLVFHAAVFAIIALRLFQRPEKAAKVQGVHGSFPVFVRVAFGWLLVAGALGIWASQAANPSGIWGASRHALTVGFLAVMVFSIGQRVLPAFAGMKLLYSPRLMLTALLLLNIGCALRVSSEVVAYQNYAAWGWHVLPISAVLELGGVTVFAVNLVATFLRPPAHLAGVSTSSEAGGNLLRKES